MVLWRFAMLAGAGLLLDSAIKGRSLADTVRGTVGEGAVNRAVGFVEEPGQGLAAVEAGLKTVASAATGAPSGGTIEEVFHDPLGYYYDSGKVVQGAIGGHPTHVHVAAHPAAIQKWARIANRQFKLTIRELEPWDKVDPVHIEGSFHYRRMAFDASGSPSDMLAFARYVINVASGKVKPQRQRSRPTRARRLRA